MISKASLAVVYAVVVVVFAVRAKTVAATAAQIGGSRSFAKKSLQPGNGARATEGCCTDTR